MIRVFILEDDPLRNQAFVETLQAPDVDLTITTNVREALETFNPPYDFMLLDHDLGGRHYVMSEEENTGYQFTCAPEVRAAVKDAPVIIHSYNYEGGIRMQKTLDEAGAITYRMPFGRALINWLRQLVAIRIAKQHEQATS